MKKILSTIIFLLLAISTYGQSFVHGAGTAGTASHAVSSSGAADIQIVPSLASNLLVSAVTYDTTNSTTVSGSDNKTNTWTVGNRTNNATNVQALSMLYSCGAASGTNIFHATVNASTVGLQQALAEFNGVAVGSGGTGCLDKNNGHAQTTTSTSVTAGSITPAQSGDLLVMCAWINSSNGTSVSVTAGSQANITWKLMPGTGMIRNIFTDSGTGDQVDHFMCQWGVYNSTVAINPTMTLGTAETYVADVLAFTPSGGAGTSPSGMYVDAVESIAQPAGLATGAIVQAPSAGNLLVLAQLSGGRNVTAIGSDSNSNTWTKIGTACTNNTTAIDWYAQNATTSGTENFTLTEGTTTSDGTLMVYDISGAATSGVFDSTSDPGCLTGSQGAAGNLTAGSITPSTANGVVIGTTGVAFNTLNGVTNASINPSMGTFTGEPVSGPEPYYQNNGWAFYPLAPASSITFTWTEKDGTTAASSWAGRIMAFEAPASPGGPPSNQFPRIIGKL